MLSVDKLTVQFLGRTLYSDLSFTVNAKDRICFAGPNGAGKSTLMKIIADQMSPDTGTVNKAKYIEVGYLPQEGIRTDGRTLFNETKTAFGDTVSLQEKIEAASSQLGDLDPASPEYADALDVYGELQLQLDKFEVDKMKPRIEKVLVGLGFKHSDMERDVGEFSGGWQMRIALAKLLLSEPSVLLLDEPTNHLDIDSQLWLENYILHYSGAVILISHDRAFLDAIVKRTLAFESGQVNEFPGNYSHYLEQSKILREQLHRAYENQQREINKAEQFINRFRAKARRASQAQSRLKQLDRMERIELAPSADKAIKLRFPQPERSGQVVIELNDAKRAYDQHVVFDQLNLRIERGEKIAVVGANGAGKSTFSRILSGADPLSSGERKTGYKVSVSHFAQDHAEKLNPTKTVLQTVEDSAAREVSGNLRSLLGCFLFRGDDVFKQVSVLSGGERSRLSLAKMLLKPANFLILDEPTNHLDMQSQQILQEALKAYQGSCVIVSHNRDFLDPITDKVIEFYPENKTPRVFLGNLTDFIEKKNQEATSSPAHSTVKGKARPITGDASIPSTNRKEQRKIEGQIRQQKANALKPIQEKLDGIESNIAELEEQKSQIEIKMRDPDFFKDKDKAIQASTEHKEISLSIEKHYSDWAATSDELERIETEFADRKA
ncbi:MAG: ABC-F family ATP-binding cassette domain-containing protein [Verrucomicrobiaceae bacterium]|nr:ABC-F family ATP-binding cassette domain-containing protein [Verrucomicrobiaceae bacterium]